MWNDMTHLVRAVFPALLLLRLADEKKPGMDKLYFYVRQMDKTIQKSKEILDTLEKNYNGTNGKFSHSTMFQYLLQTITISDFCNEFKNQGEDDHHYDDSSSDSDAPELPWDDSDGDDTSADYDNYEQNIGR